MATRISLFGLVFFLGMVSTAQADIGPPRVREDIVNIRLHTAKDYSDFLVYVCRSDRAPEQITIAPDKPIVLEGTKGTYLWLAAVPKDIVEKLGGEEKLLKSLAGKRIDGVLYSKSLAGSRPTKGPGAVVVDNYEITGIEKKVVSLVYLSEADAKKKFGQGSGSGSKQVFWPTSPNDGNDDSQPPFWSWDKLRLLISAVTLSVALAFGGLWLARRRQRATIAAAPTGG